MDPITSAATAAAGSEIGKGLYHDVRAFAVSRYRSLSRNLGRLFQKAIAGPHELRTLLAAGQIAVDSEVLVDCRPSHFGPFIRDLVLLPMIGNHSSNRLGPSIDMGNPIFSMMANVMSHWMPAALYPSLGGAFQGGLLEPASPVLGVVSLLAPQNEFFPAVFAERHRANMLATCFVRGVVRALDAKALIDSGLSEEAVEALRSRHELFFLDVTSPESELTPQADGTRTELWCGLYAEGHLEFDGQISIAKAAGAAGDAMQGFSNVHVSEIQGAIPGLTAFAQGARIFLMQGCRFGVHMDSEIALSYEDTRTRFDQMTKRLLTNLADTVSLAGATLQNPFDIDFTYTDSAKLYSVLRSASAEAVVDPVGRAMRDWHRTRNA